jgi:hypothetical protein
MLLAEGLALRADRQKSAARTALALRYSAASALTGSTRAARRAGR